MRGAAVSNSIHKGLSHMINAHVHVHVRTNSAEENGGVVPR